jgi:integrase
MGYASRSINVHRSMLSMTLDPVEGKNVGEHPFVIQLLKGCYNTNPPRPRYEASWDSEVVLDYLASLGNDQSLDFDQLTYKLVTLLALVTLMRISELASISCASVSLSSSKVSFSLLRLRKKQVSGPLENFSVPAFNGSLVCPVSCFSEYWKRTSSMRAASCASLFVITKKPHTGASSSTIGRWIKSCIMDAGIDGSVFSAHSTRGAGASKAFASGVATDDILRAASWSSESIFARHYKRPIVSPSPVPAAIISQTSSR